MPVISSELLFLTFRIYLAFYLSQQEPLVDKKHFHFI